MLKPGPPHPKFQTPPRVWHIDNYARVTVGDKGILAGEPGERHWPRAPGSSSSRSSGARDQVRLFTHTLEPVARPGGGSAYGCTEFAFPVGAGASVGQVLGVVDRVLTVQAR